MKVKLNQGWSHLPRCVPRGSITVPRWGGVPVPVGDTFRYPHFGIFSNTWTPGPGALSLCRHNGLRLSYTGSCRTLSITCLSSFFKFFCNRPSQSGYCIIPAGPIPIPRTRSSEERHPVTFQVSLYPQQNFSLAFDSTQSQPSHLAICLCCHLVAHFANIRTNVTEVFFLYLTFIAK